MKSKRAVQRINHVGANQYILRMRDFDPSNREQQWAFDSRTHSIREFYRRNYAIGLRNGQRFRVGAGNYVVTRPYNKQYQRWKWVAGRSKNF